ncbi:helix-turn-helix transcriptional regulator [Actinoallomurus spadix]|uniref:helix-turn-helix domain-containing protein n=1 Tax=Actinoallomurus spadix TaxID=79912 RepID=UPI002092B108|nr:helix-turn-helix transcriptional regulator [Actinoallomurus spadix]MCO5987181.1 helix-turn-helix transcriptional regulator [Actinoallomurus spadix]
MTTLGNGSGPTTPDSDSPEGDMGYRREVDPTTSVAALFAHKLRKYRDANGWTQDALADRVGCTGDLISKIETAKRSATTSMSEDFDRLFALDGYFAELQPLAARELALGWFRPFLEAEGTASSMHIFEPMLITGLLQNEDYARAVLAAGNHPDRVEQLVATRMERQQILRRDEPPWIVLLLAEYAIRRKVGGPEVMRAQLQRLLDAMKEPDITVQVLPEEAPIYLSMPFTIMGFRRSARGGLCGDGRNPEWYHEGASARRQAQSPLRLGQSGRIDRCGVRGVHPFCPGGHMNTEEPRSVQWRRSARSNEEGGQCVEVAVVEEVRVGG